MERNLLLVSNSTLHGSGYLDHCEGTMRTFLGKTKCVLFVPYARPSGKTWDEYTAIARERFKKMGFELTGIHEHRDPRKAVEGAEAIFIGGGNTFVLLDGLYHQPLRTTGSGEMMEAIRQRVSNGMPYIGTSAGSNVAGKTIRTTNDLPIKNPGSFGALGLVPFIINPHYQDAIQLTPERTKEILEAAPELKTWLGHQGETRETRIKEYHCFNDDTVVGLREGAMLLVTNRTVTLLGTTGARIFRKGHEPTEHLPGESLDFLLN